MGFVMNRYSTLAFTFLLTLSQCISQAEARQPNIILIMADDLGYEAIGANGGESYQTPHLDELAATGMRFDRCYVQPLCTPTRVELMTGQSNVRNYIRFGLLDPNATTFAQLLKRAGYVTGIAGKWQLGREPGLPQAFGFDESCLWQQTRFAPRYANPGLEYDNEQRDFHDGEYGPDLVNDFAIDFVTRHKDKPFLLYYPMVLTHAPYQPTPDSKDWDPKTVGEQANVAPRHFGEMVTYMDKLIGKLTATLDELDIRDETLVIFLGDNGTGKGTVSRFRGGDFKGGKGQSTARGMHVPLIVNWPGHVPAGKVNDELVSSVDFLPTLCAAAGVKPPPTLTLDGYSFLPQALGEGGTPRPPIYSWYSQHGGGTPTHELAMSKQYKLYSDGRLFDLDADPLEEAAPLDNGALSAAQAAAAEELRGVIAMYAGARPAALQGPPLPPVGKQQLGRRAQRRQARAAAER